MARAALSGRLTWQLARVAEIVAETPHTKTISLNAPDWPGHRAGQHVDVRLTAEDGYQAQRSYSIASSPQEPRLRLTVQRIDDGEVSPYLTDELRPGDELELRGPIGGYFVWEPTAGGPLLLIAGGSGIVPFRSMVGAWAAASRAEIRVLYSSRSLEDVFYRQELERLAAAGGLDLHLVLTRRWPDDWAGARGRIDAELLAELAWPPERRPLIYVCGPSSFVETIADGLVQAGHEPSRIRTERFGPTGT